MSFGIDDRFILDLFIDKHISLISKLDSIDVPRKPTAIEILDCLPIEVSSIDAHYGVTYTTLIVFGSSFQCNLDCSTIFS
jgi:hypothetical protein